LSGQANRIVSSIALAGGLLVLHPATAAEPAGRRMGFVVTYWDNALYETTYMEECPAGMTMGSDEIWFEGLSPRDKDVLTGSGAWLPTEPKRKGLSYLRGKNGEDVCWNPELVAVPPPKMKIVRGKTSFGMNLDGLDSGTTSPKSCAHDNFVSPEGEPGIDNQMYRLLGCISGFRKAGYIGDHANRERRDEGQGNILILLDDVDDPRNDPSVKVSFFLAATPLPHDASGGIMPFSTYAVRGGRYGDTVQGSIKDGVIETVPAEVSLPAYGNDGAYPMLFRDFRLKLAVAPDGRSAGGIWAGYYDFASFWDGLIKVQHDAHVGEYDCPSIYFTAQEIADGYPDPATGKCTALSSAFKLEAVAAFIITDDPTKVAAAP